ncbi:hypothetical protein GGS21DRAFT_34359 [Xylaria nigripes]|nr:hypothetical protein GGS21DRAFT_34359 [Xylaria nigripes]
MCHGHPHYHPCSHTSVKWLYCPEAVFDLKTGYETPCANPIYSTAQPVNSDCPLQNCNFKALKGSWNCCVCGQGPNTQGWCTVMSWVVDVNPLTGVEENMEVPCGHGCCTSSRTSSPEISFVEARKGRVGRKGHSSSRSSGHRRSSTYDYGGSFSAIVEADETIATSSSAAHNTRSSRKSTYDASVEYLSKKSKTSSSGKKKGYKTRSQY